MKDERRPSGRDASAALRADPDFRNWVESLQRRLPAFSAGKEAARAQAASADAPAIAPGSAPSALSPPSAASARREQYCESVAYIAKAWPAHRRDSLQRLSDILNAVCLIWGPLAAGSADEVQRSHAALTERRDAAVRFASGLLYSTARAASIEEDTIDELASTVASELGALMFRDSSAVFAVPRGTFTDAEHEFVGPRLASSRIRALTFGIRSRGRVSSKASVEADAPAGGLG